jgi:hypothetical protein
VVPNVFNSEEAEEEGGEGYVAFLLFNGNKNILISITNPFTEKILFVIGSISIIKSDNFKKIKKI